MNVKGIYFDLRMGQAVVFPLLAMVNFIIISYSLTDISKIMPMEYYVPLVISVMAIALIGVGKIFRFKQQVTDFTMVYENHPQHLLDIDALLSDDQTKKQKRLEYHKEILKKHKL